VPPELLSERLLLLGVKISTNPLELATFVGQVATVVAAGGVPGLNLDFSAIIV